MVSHATVGEDDALEEVGEPIRQSSSFQPKSWGFAFQEVYKRTCQGWSPGKDLCEDRIPHIMAHHMSFLYSKLGPQGQRLHSRINQLSGETGLEVLHLFSLLYEGVGEILWLIRETEAKMVKHHHPIVFAQITCIEEYISPSA